MRTITLLLALFVCAAIAEAQYTQPWQVSKYIYNGTSAYTTGKVVGASPDSLNMWPAAPDSLGHGGYAQHPNKWVMLQSITFIDSLAQDPSMEAWIMDSRTGSLVDDSTFGLSWADLQHVVAVIPFGTTWYASSPGAVNVEPQVNVMMPAPVTSYVKNQPPRYFWCYFVCRSSKTWTVAKTLKIKMNFFWQ